MTINTWFKLIVLLVLSISMVGCNSIKPSQTKEITISAAASLKEPLVTLQEQFEKENPKIELFFNYGGSGALKNQIVQGAPVDVYISANKQNVLDLINEEKMRQDGVVDLLSNQLVVIKSKREEKVMTFNDLAQSNQKFAIGHPNTVPAGMYAKEALTSIGLWETLQKQLVYAKDVRHVLSLVEQGSVVGGIVYQSDARSSNKVQVMKRVSEDTYSQIMYSIGVIDDSSNKTIANSFVSFLTNSKAQKVFEDSGFVPLKIKE
ncbi:molybdate ABC transporter substrate-binding protein [Pontibacillus yanchengensis]|uniref:Molybdate ABC transporter substrate-binding protein n=2 Tax=Pontibacillus yanchengensis TaxID=462910 RepID=A0ACC7VC28_9BACI|nr:molybdate ABC transporter substrate-binding protein [Pontibacillus yanchengensis]MYL34683.1 molybdate ABC transporter substrate-binding protein [Pontibacillus yanchengensis]MYL52332.1 molybdate ABC transporter substrate-binding protein [Pontibacillus yanchengensis]